MNQMNQGQNNFKDIKKDSDNSPLSLKDRQSYLSYKKTNKLVTALYMVTDILDANEPIRHRLRTLGLEVLSDITSNGKLDLVRKIQEVLYLLDIAFTLNMVSRMNADILKNEFYELRKSIQEFYLKNDLFAGKATLFEFLNEETEEGNPPLDLSLRYDARDLENKGQVSSTRIGVQKGSTLMKALSDKMFTRPIEGFKRPLEKTVRPIEMSFKNGSKFSVISDKTSKDKTYNNKDNQDFDLIKKQRRFEIVSVIKSKGDSVNGTSITDIKTLGGEALASCSEKTLQRELVAMVSDGVLKKTGLKRWSRYFLLS